jgi:predicted nucleic acid-binding protein
VLIVDAGPLVAVADSRSREHSACRKLLEEHPGPLIVPTLVIAEVAYLVQGRLGTRAEALFLGALAEGALIVEPVHPADWTRILDLVQRYSSLPLGTTDASVLACAERLGCAEVATLDRRHFTVVPPGHIDVLTLLP